jgi:hypothetical protein
MEFYSRVGMGGTARVIITAVGVLVRRPDLNTYLSRNGVDEAETYIFVVSSPALQVDTDTAPEF